jgi:hypothetical protein
MKRKESPLLSLRPQVAMHQRVTNNFKYLLMDEQAMRNEVQGGRGNFDGLLILRFQ